MKTRNVLILSVLERKELSKQNWFQCLRYVQWNLPSVSKLKVRVSVFFPGGVDNCVKLWNARSICNPDDEEEDGSDAK